MPTILKFPFFFFADYLAHDITYHSEQEHGSSCLLFLSALNSPFGFLIDKNEKKQPNQATLIHVSI